MEPKSDGRQPRKYLYRALYVIAAGIVVTVLAPALKGCYTSSVGMTSSKFYSETRALATALESYHTKYGAYPPGVPVNAGDIVRHDNSPLLTLNLDRVGLKPASIGLYRGFFDKGYEGKFDFRDWYTARFYHRSAHPYRYYPKGGGWILISTGPDGDYDIDPATAYDPANRDEPSLQLFTTAGSYDPTNGTESNGDLWRVRQ